MLLLGHRGCRGRFTENTLAAFDHAIQGGCDGFEFDVRLSSDQVPVIWHDSQVRGRSIARQTFSKLCERCATAEPPLCKVDERMAASGETIELCRLEEVLARYAHSAWLDIELKVRGMETLVAGLLRRYPPARGFVVSSFHGSVLREVHRADPALPLALIFDRMPPEETWRKLPIQFVKPEARLVTVARVRQFHAAGLKVLTWTVNLPAEMRRLSAAGVDGIIGDDPAALVRVLRELCSESTAKTLS